MTNNRRNRIEGRLLRRGVPKFINKHFVSMDLKIGDRARLPLMEAAEVVPNRIVFANFQGNYSCNPKYICEELIKRKLPVEIYWFTKSNVDNAQKSFPKGVTLVEYGSVEAFLALASSRIWIDNAFNCIWKNVSKKDNQVFIETWHGSMGLKRINSESVGDKYWSNRAKASRELIDYCISDSSFETEVFRSSHWPNNNILEYGHPRNDILFKKQTREQRMGILEKIGVIHYDRWTGELLEKDVDDIRICLYAPTFRDGETSTFNLDYDKLTQSLEKRYGHKWLIARRLHRKNIDGDRVNSSKVVDVTDYVDMQELMVIADAGITDYSSWICDYVLTGKPGFIYAPDLAKYESTRGFYYPLETTPFPIAQTEEELQQNIIDFDNEKYQEDAERFLKDRGCYEDGHASERVVDLIEKIINEQTIQQD